MTTAITPNTHSPAAIAMLRQHAGQAFEPRHIAALDPQGVQDLCNYLTNRGLLHITRDPCSVAARLITTDEGLTAIGMHPWETVMLIGYEGGDVHTIPYEVIRRCDPERYPRMSIDAYCAEHEPRYHCPSDELMFDIMLTADCREPFEACGYYWVAYEGILFRLVTDDEEAVAPSLDPVEWPPAEPVTLPNGVTITPIDAPHEPHESHDIRGGIPC